MQKYDISKINHVSETLLIPLYCRAIENNAKKPIIKDPFALQVLEKINYDVSKLKIEKFTVITTVMRVKQFDEYLNQVIQKNPDSIVINIGAGLDTRFTRVDNGSIEWYDIDFPAVIELRNQLIPTHPRITNLEYSVLDFEWMNLIKDTKDRNVIILAEGVFMYLFEKDMKLLLQKISEKFPGSDLIFDAAHPFMIKHTKNLPAFKATQSSFNWAIKSVDELQKWNSNYQLKDVYYYFKQKVKRLGWYKLFRFVPYMRNYMVILYYHLNNDISINN